MVRLSSLLPALLFVAGTIVAMLGSWNVSLWTDEAATISAARRSTGELWSLVHHIDAVHAAYYFGMHYWGGAFGWSAFSLRLPSAIAVGVTVVGVWALARSVGRPDAALPAAVIAIVLPRITWMGIEARSFGPSAAVAVWATVLFVRALRDRTSGDPEPRRTAAGRWSIYAALVAVGCALNIYLALLVVAHGVSVVLLLATRNLRAVTAVAWFVAAVVGAGLAAPVVLASLGQRGQLGDNAVTAGNLVRRALVNQFFLGETPTRVATSSDGTSLWSLAAPVLAVLCWLLIAAGIVVAVRRRGGGSWGSAPSTTEPWGIVAVALPWLLVPTIIVGAYSLAVSPLYNPRYFTFCAPAAALLIGLGVSALRRRWLAIAVTLLIVALATPIYLSQRQETGKSGTDWSSTAAWVAARATSGDGVYFAPLDVTSKPTFERTTGNVAVAYPAAFRGLRDITRVRTAVAADSLRPLAEPLARATDRLAGLDRVFVVRLTDYPAASSAADDAILEREGFHAVARRIGPMSTVVEFRR